jgi:hypothetical protein
MNIDKSHVLELLRSRGEDQKAEQADSALPDQVDPEQHKGVLDDLGIDVGALVTKLPGLGSMGL